MQKILFILALIAVLTIPVLALAKSDNANPNAPGQNTSPSPTVSSSATSHGNNLNQGHKNWEDQYNEYKNAGQEKKQETLQNLGETLVQNRITLLNTLRTMVQNMTGLSEETKQQILAEIDKAIQDMNTVQSNIANQGDLQQLKNQIQSMFQNQIYSVEAPKDLGQGLTAQGMYILGRLQAIQRQLEQTLNQNKNAGKDTTQLEQLMTQVQNQLKIAQEQLVIADEKFKSMTPANTEAAKTSREEGKTAFRQAKDALKEARRLLVQIREQLRTMTGTSASPSTSASPTASPTATISPTVSPSPTISPTP